MKPFLILLLLITIVSCNKRQPNNKIVHFMADTTISAMDGMPLDSLSPYFPKKLYLDSIRYYVYEKDTFEFKSNENVETIIKDRNLNKQKVKVLDTVLIKDVSFFSDSWSFGLFKMKEPILYNYNLHKEIYRLIISQSFSRYFIVINVEKSRKGIFITMKRLNRQVGYPFMVYAEPVFFNPPGENHISQQERDKLKHENDSIAAKYNNTNYYVDSLINKRITWQQWNEIQRKLVKIKYWDSYPKTCGDCVQIDGSRWILEGQNEDGYQIHEVLSPFDNYDNKNEYSDLFKFIVKISGLNTDKFWFY